MSEHSNAIVTASYAPDFERCRLLCETIDLHVSSFKRHYLLVEGRDVAQFRALESAHRIVVDERDILPSWLRPFNDPLIPGRRIWLSLRTMPLRGWHVQQLRRIAIAGHIDEEALIFCDSDVVFVKPLDCGLFWNDDKVKLLRHDNALERPQISDQYIWSRNAGEVLGIESPKMSLNDYISTVIAWRRSSIVAMCQHIENVQGMNWVAAVARRRKFSECMLYGRFVDEIAGGAGHFHSATELCHVHWEGKPMSDEEFRTFVDEMEPEQVAVGMQSAIGTDVSRIRRLVLEDA